MTDIGSADDSPRPRQAGTRKGRRKSASGFMPLEPRIMYDAAAAATTNDAADTANHDPTTLDAATPDHAATPSSATDNRQAQPQTDASAAEGVQVARINQLVVIDDAVGDKQALLDGLKPGEQAFILNGDTDGVQQIADYIRDNDLHDLSAIQIVSHGEEGQIHLGSIVLSSSNIADHTQALAEIGGSLAQGGDILLYGCNVASATGSLFLANLSSATGGADIAASVDKTGAASLGGNWTLEQSTGSIEAGLPFADAALDGYGHLLATGTFTNSTSFEALRVSPLVTRSVVVSGMTGTVTDVSVTLTNINHSFPGNWDMILVGPDGTSNLIFMSDVGGGNSVSNKTVTFIDSAAASPGGSIVNGSFKPTDNLGSEGVETASTWGLTGLTVNHAGPVGAATFASAFGGISPNGTWTLYVKSDEGGNTFVARADSWTLTLTTSGAAPQIGALNAQKTATEQQTLEIDNSVNVSDADSATLASGTVTIGNYHAGEDELLFTADSGTMGNITGSFDAGTGVLSLSSAGATATLAQWTAALRAVDYRNSSDTPDTSDRTITFVVNDGSSDSAPATQTVHINAVNDAPTATITPTTYSATEQTNLTLHGTGLSVADVDGASGVATLSAGSGILTVSAGSSGATIGNNGTGSVTITGTITQINDLLAGNGGATVMYNANLDAPPASTTLTLAFNDQGNSGTGSALDGQDTATINIAGVNDAPVNTVPGGQTVNEDTNLVFSSGNGNLVSISDVDAGSSSVRVTLSVTNGVLTLSQTTGLTFTTGDGAADATMVFTGTIANINAALSGLIYRGNSNYNGADTLSITTNDLNATGTGGAKSDTDTVAITVNAVNDPPTLTATTKTPTFTENGSAVDLFDNVSISTVEGDGINRLVFTVQNVSDASAEFIGFDGTNINLSNATGTAQTASHNWTYTVAIAGSTTTVTITQTISNLTNLQNAIDGMTYRNASENPTAGNRVVTLTQIRDTGDTANGGQNSTSLALASTVTVAAVNDAPVAVANSYSVDEDATLLAPVAAQGVLGNDSDVDTAAGSLSAVLVSDVSNGTLALNSDGTFTYVPNANFNGSDSFTYKVNDGAIDSNIVTVSITVNSVNDPPTATDDSFNVSEDSGATALDVLANDSFVPDTGETLSVTAITQPTHGAVTLTGGVVRYQPDANYYGADSFTYTISDGNGGTATGTVNMMVRAVADTPTVTGATTNEDTQSTSGLVISRNAADGAEVTHFKITNISNGALYLNDGTTQVNNGDFITFVQANAGLKFTPVADFFGGATFDIHASLTNADVGLGGAVTTATVTVNSVNDAPIAAADNYSVNEDATLTVNAAAGVLANDNDVDTASGSLSAVLVSGVSHGSLTLNADGSFTYTPAANYNGSDSFTYKVNDGALDSNTVTVTITVDAVNDAPTFGIGDGKLVTPFGSFYDIANNVAVQSDGKLVVAGVAYTGTYWDFALARYNADGTPDTSFGTNGTGKVGSPFGASQTGSPAISIQSDGKIVVSATIANDFGLARYNADGTLDTSFGGGTGKVVTPVGGGVDVARSLAIQPDGKIVVVGYAYAGLDDFAVVRYNANGTLDTTFDGDGKATTRVGSSYSQGYSVSLQSDGKIVVAGRSNNGSGDDFALVRYNVDGSLDTTFNGTGKVVTPVGTSNDIAYSVTVLLDGKILVAGYGGVANNDFALLRYNADGTLDTSFGTGGTGKVLTPVGTSNDYGTSAVVQPDGKIVVAGYGWNGSNDDFAVVRYNADGTLDMGFGSGGKVLTPIGSSTDQAFSVALQPDGKIVVAGSAIIGGVYNDFAVVRYNADGTLDTSFGIVSTLNNTASFTEGGAPVVLDSSVSVFDVELSAANNFGGATVTLARNGGASAQDVFSGSGALSALTEGGNLVVSGTTIGTVTTNSGGTLVLTFNASATQALVNAALGAIAYSNSSDAPPASVQIGWTFSDGNSGGQGSGGALTATGSTTVNITSVNDAPSGADKTITLANATGHAFAAADFGFTDIDGNSLAAVKITTTPGAGTLTLTGSGAVTAGQLITVADINAGKLIFTPTGTAFSASYASFTFQVQDNGGTANGGVNLDPSANTISIRVLEAQSLTVTTTSDVADDYDGETSLREAIAYANTHSGADTVTFSGTLSGQTFRFGSLLPTISGELTIDGDLDNNGTADITISGDVAGDDVHSSGVITDVAASSAAGKLADNLRIFNATAALTIDGLVLTGGYSAASGGAIAGADVTLRHAIVQGNQSDFLGGGVFAANNLSVADSTISNNRAAGGAGFSVTADNATVTIDRSVISGNEAFASSAGGFYIGSTISTAVITDSTIRDNRAAVAGGGFVSNGSVSLTNTTISGNTALASQAGGGTAGSLTATNVTVSGNTAGNGSGGLASNFAMTLVNSTVSGNTTAAGTGGVQTYFGNLTLTNSIVLGNSAGGSESNISAGGTLTRNGGNIIGTDVFSGGTDVGDTTAAAVFAQTVDIGNGVTAGVLADNGGRVQTIALKRDVTNPALDTGNDGAAPGADARGVAYRDVLGVANNAANISDLGAFEAEPEARGLTVHTANDIVDQFDNLTSLREAITYANSLGGSQGIDFTGGLTNQTLWLASALPTITANLTIDGRSGLTISGDVLQDDVRAAGSSVITDVAASYSSTPVSNRLADNVQIFNLSSALTLNTLILTGGYSATTGGAVLGTDVTLNGTTVRGNLSVGNGGGLYATGSFSATNSTISDNFAGRPGASTAASGGGFYSDGGTISLLNTTVSKSTARLDGGGFYASGNATITIDGSTISGNTATAGKGGGFRVNGASADVTVNDSTVSGNFALDGGGGFSIAGSASLARSTVSGNSSTGNHSGGATVLGTLTAADSTFSGNDGLFAGAIYAGAANLTNVTISGNTATGVVGGVYVTGNVTLTNSIVLGNAGPAGESSVLSTGGTITRNGGNIIGKASGGADVFVDGTDNGDTTAAAVFAQTATVGGVSAGVLANNGGAVQTIALRRSVTNPALDTSNSSASGSDARGIGPFDLNSLGNEGGGTNTRDLGAYEIDSQETQSLTVTTLSDVADPFDDQTSLREAITYANNLGGSQTVTFANGLSGGLIRLAYLLPTITTTVTFDGDLDDSGSADITITGDVGDDDTTVSGEITDIAASSGRLGDNIRLFNATVGLTVDGLVLTGGNDSSTASGAGGGAIRATNVTLTNATVQGNYAARNGGGVYASGNLNVTGSTISGNSAEMGAGLFASGDFAQVTIGRSTISKNIARAGDGGGLGVTGSSSNVTVTDTTISGNTASAGQGGGLATGNGLSLTRVTVSGNSAVQGGGASVMSITATNTTIAGNTATIAGGISAAAQTTLVNSTVTGNSATTLTGGILAGNGFTLTNSIVLGNSANGSVNEFQSFGAQVRSGGNIIGKTGGADVLSGNIDIGDTTAAEVFAQTATVGGVQAGVLGDNGGLVQTVALKASGANPALDASNGSAPTADARGEARVDHTGVGNNGSNFADLGAYEVQVLPVAAATSGGTTASFEQIAVVIDAGVTVTNSLGPTLTSATVSISPASFESGQDVLGFVNDNTTMGDIVASYSAGTGVLTLTSASGTATVTQWQAALRAVTYTNTSNTPETSDRIISFSAADGSFSSARPTKTVSVTAVNDAPVGTDKTVIADADTDYVLGAADFPYTDFESDGLLEVEITTVPALGTLTLDGVAVSAGDFVSAADLAAGKLIYHPPADAFGHGYASFTFRVRDGGGTANNGQNFDQSANTVTIDVRETKSLIVTTDADVGDDYDGVTSLRDAIAYANVHAGGDTITFTNALSGHTVRLAGLLPTITESLAIDGDLDNNGTPDIAITGDVNNDDRHANGSTVITDIAASITANRLADNVRIFSSTAPLTVEGLILTGGVDMTIAAGEGGGAIRGSSVSLSYTTVAGNFAAVNGGGVYASGDVIATDSKISGNFANISIGGVISTGGGFYSGGGTVFIVRSTISGNSAALGGGFYSSHANANITVDQTTISGNEVFDGGGGGFRAGGASSVANISDAMIGGNTANGSGGGFSSAGRVTLTRATVSGNSSTGVEGGGGHAATLTATNTTVSGNTASSGRAGGFSTSGDMTLTNSTVSGNTAASIVGGLRASGDLTLTNLIVLGNSVGGSESNAVAGDTLIRNGNNIIGTDVFSGSTDIGDTTAAAVFAQTVTVGGVSAGVLANNGGALQTIALRESATNPALDRANASAPATDARGEARADQPGVGSDGSNFADLGAYELANSVPVVTTSGGATAADEQTATVIDASITVVDTDSATLASATVSITGAFQTAEDVLAFVNDGSTMGNIDGSYDAGTGVLTLTSSGASATLTQWQAALRAVTYINTADAPETTDRTISFVVNDGGFTSVTKTKTVAVIPVNDTPVNTIPAGPLTALEDVGLAITGLTVADVDADPIGALITVTLSVQHGTLHVRDNVGGGLTAGEITGNDSATVTLTCHSDRISATLGALNGLVYTSDLNYNGADTLTMTTNDGGANGVDPGGDPNFEETTSTVAINVVPVNDVPSFTKGADQTVAEDAGSQTVNNWATNLSTGPANESTQGLSFVVTNDNNAMFSVQPSVDAGGKLIYTPAADANGTATVTVAIMDDGGTSNGGVDTSTTQTFTITITPVNDAPVITLSGQIANFLVDTLAPVPVVPGIVIADIDSTTLDGVTVSITAGFTAGDQLNFVNQAGITGIYDAATGVLTLTGNASLAAYRTALASITFETNDRDGGQRTLTWIADDGGAVDNTSLPRTSIVEVTAETLHTPSKSPNVTNTGPTGGSGLGPGDTGGTNLITSVGGGTTGGDTGTTGGSYFYVSTEIQTIITGSQLQIQIPIAELAAPLGGDIASVTATLLDGSALPAWLEFDPVTGTLKGNIPNSVISGVQSNSGQLPDDVTTGNLGQSNPPAGSEGSISIQVKLVDSQGNVSTTIFTIKVAPQKGGWLLPRGLSPELSPWRENARDHAAIELNRDLTRLLSGATFAGLAAIHDGDIGDADVASAATDAPRGRAGLSEQLGEHGWRSMHADRRTLLASLQRGVANWR